MQYSPRKQKAAWVPAWLLLILFTACDDPSGPETWKKACWSTDQTSVALVSGREDTDLLVGRWPDPGWKKLAAARQGCRFLHPLWLKDAAGNGLVAVFEIGEFDSKGKEDVGIRILRAVDGADQQELAASATAEILAMKEELLAVQAAPDSESLLYAGKIGDHWEIREWRPGTPGGRTILSTPAEGFEVQISENLPSIAILEEFPDNQSILSIYPLGVAWSGPIFQSDLNNLLHMSYINFNARWKLCNWSPDGAWLLLEGRAGDKSALLLCRPLDGLLAPISMPGRLGRVSWSAGSRYFAFQAEFNAPSGKSPTLTIYDCYSNITHSFSLDPNSELAGWSSDDRILVRSTTEQGQRVDGLDPQQGHRSFSLLAGREDLLLVSTAGRMVLYHGDTTQLPR